MEMILNPSVRSLTGITLPPVATSSNVPLEVVVNQWILYIILNGILATILSIILSTIFYYGFEKPVTSFVKSVIDGRENANSSRNKKKNT